MTTRKQEMRMRRRSHMATQRRRSKQKVVEVSLPENLAREFEDWLVTNKVWHTCVGAGCGTSEFELRGDVYAVLRDFAQCLTNVIMESVVEDKD